MLAYWLANFTMDYAKYLVFGFFTPLLIIIVRVDVLIDHGNIEFFWVLCLEYGLSIITFAYILSFYYKDPSGAQVMVFLISFLTCLILPMILLILYMIESTRDLSQTFRWVFRLFLPPFCFGNAVYMISSRQLITLFEREPELISAWDDRIGGLDLKFLAFHFVFFWILIILIENFKNVSFFTNLMVKANLLQAKPMGKEDQDVVDERNKVAALGVGDTTIRVNNARKVYTMGMSAHKVAVNSVSFEIPEGECFALLGVNGAGKTTLFKMLTGDINPTSGQLSIGGFAIPEQIQQARQLIGYCPQTNALLANLTGREHLDLFATIKGIPEEIRPRIVSQKIHEMGLQKYADRTAGTYSGGNKRKLMVALAMIGNPPIVFLDEPSTGMDPEARRFMWNVISQISTVKKQSSVIITTHSMEEAEALAQRIAIQVDGSLKCIGPVQRLKSKYGKGYEFDVKVKPPSKDDLISMIQIVHT